MRVKQIISRKLDDLTAQLAELQAIEPDLLLVFGAVEYFTAAVAASKNPWTRSLGVNWRFSTVDRSIDFSRPATNKAVPRTHDPLKQPAKTPQIP